MSTRRKSLKYFSLVLLGALLGKSVSFSSKVSANPADVKGSGGVVVQAYVNSKGSFLLRSDGSITSATTGALENSPKSSTSVVSYTPTPTSQFQPFQSVVGQILGSPNVPVGVTQDSTGTYVVFSNGSIFKPTSTNANAAPVSGKVAWAQIRGGSNNPVIAAQSGGFQSVALTAKGNKSYDYTVTFTPNYFAADPCVMVTNFQGASTTYLSSCNQNYCIIANSDMSNGNSIGAPTDFNLMINIP